MISRIKKNFAELMESLTIKKDEILKQNKIINLERRRSSELLSSGSFRGFRFPAMRQLRCCKRL